jgi:hypothetical protein
MIGSIFPVMIVPIAGWRGFGHLRPVVVCRVADFGIRKFKPILGVGFCGWIPGASLDSPYFSASYGVKTLPCGRGSEAVSRDRKGSFFNLERSIQLGFAVWPAATPDGSCVRLLFRH